MSNFAVSHQNSQIQGAISKPQAPVSQAPAQQLPPANAVEYPINKLPIEDHIHVLPPNKIDSISIGFFSPTEAIIDNAMNRASAKYPGAQSDALRNFHEDIAHMTQNELDEMKDALVDRLASPESSQWDRNFLHKMYEMTDAVAEHRDPGLKPGKLPFPMPGGGGDTWPSKPVFPKEQWPMPSAPDFGDYIQEHHQKQTLIGN